MRVLGVDPGTRIVGYGLVDQAGNRLTHGTHGTVAPGRKPTVPMRLRAIFEGLTEVIRTWEPDVVAVEQVFFGKSVKSAIRIGEGRAVAVLAAAIQDLPVAEYAPAVVKKALVGSGAAVKSQVALMVQTLLSLDEIPASDDASDALAIAICHCHRADAPMIGGRS
jgi:crossover junction endodeoxyribonuclease RuvC